MPMPRRQSSRAALAGLQSLEAPTAHDEAEAIALILRETIETPGKTAALDHAGPDACAARGGAAEVLRSRHRRFGGRAGRAHCARRVPRSRDRRSSSDFAPPELMALLKHPLTLLGREPGKIREAARALERGSPSATSMSARGSPARQRPHGCARRGAAPERSSAEDDERVALRLVDDLQAAFAPLSALFADGIRHDRRASRRGAWRRRRSAGAAIAPGPLRIFGRATAGEAMSVLLAELIAEGGSVLLAPGLRALLSQPARRPRGAAAPAGASAPLHLGPARSAPAAARPGDPRQPQRGRLAAGRRRRPVAQPADAAKLGLPAPERRIGLSAHDFAQALARRQRSISPAPSRSTACRPCPRAGCNGCNALVEAA